MGEHDFLQLEAGEDVDEVTGALRQNIQIRDRAERPTLTATRDFLARSFKSQGDNPGWNCAFVYCSTADAGLEVNSPFKLPGIEVWNQLSARSESEMERIAALRKLLLSFDPPKGCSSDTWAAFTDFIERSQPAEFRDFVRRVTYQCASIRSEALREEAIEQLSYLVPNPDQAYQRLFYAVFKELSRKGPKILCRADLNSALSAELTPSERADLDFILARLADQGVRLESLERRVSAIELGSRTAPDMLAEAASTVLAARRVPAKRSDDVFRDGLVADVWDRLNRCAWIAISGGSGEGKSTAAAQIVEAGEAEWVSLGNTSEAALRILNALRMDLAQDPAGTWLTAARNAHGQFIVLDDVPNLVEEAVHVRILEIARACGMHRKHVITLSHHPIPATRLDNCLSELAIVPFSHEEIRRSLVASGAPPHALTEPFISSIEAVTRGHPELLALARHLLVGREWDISVSQMLFILGREVAESIADIVQVQLRDLSPEARSMLCRLAVPLSSYSRTVAADLV